ncbi:MAG: hypothetical protein ACTSRS_10870 [Candidatus Helarchaeota archaeon]
MQDVIYWITINEFLISIVIFIISFYVLFRKWYSANRRYYTDLPFILAIGYIFLIADRLDSVLGLSGIMPITLASQTINFISFEMIVTIIIIVMLMIWIPEKIKVRIGIIVCWIALMSIMAIIFIWNPQEIHALLFLMSVPMFALLVVTWFFSYFTKRLSVINPLLVGIGFTGFLIATILRAYFSVIGEPLGYVFTNLHWIAILIDIISFLIILRGFTEEMNYST